MSIAKSVLGIVPGLQATALVAHNIPKNYDMKKAGKMDMKPAKNITKKAVSTMVGVGLMKPTASMINTLN